MKAYERLLSYVKVFTPSSEETGTSPSTQYQFDLARLLVQELRELGVKDADVDEHCYVYGHIPATRGYESRQKLGFIAHMDTVSDFCDHPVTPVITPNYDGKDLALGTSGRVLSPKMFPHLSTLKGRTLITSDGTTILGADDKAGIAEIMTIIEHLNDNTIPHGPLCIAFTPDEEIGRGTEHFPLTDFSADFAYTVDGGAVGELNYETFNACNATVTFYGVSVHPGSAKNKMRNAVTMAAKWQMLLPAGERPEYTELYEGFYHSLRINGGTDKVELEMILRDHDRKKLEDRKKLLLHMVDCLNAEYGAGSVVCKMEDVYCNMKEYIMPVYEIIERAENAMRAAGIEPHLVPVRGGTDGARLSEMGLPCPNIFTGGHNFHGRFEYLPVPSLLKCVEVLVKLVQK